MEKSLESIAADSLFGFYLRKKEYRKAEEYLDYFAEADPLKKIYQGRLYKEQGETKNAYRMYENVVWSGYQTLNFAFSFMTRMAIEEGDMRKARYLADKNGKMAQVLEFGRYQECASMLDVVCAQKNVRETYQIAKQLLESLDSLYDCQKSELYRHMSFQQPGSSMVGNLREKMLDGFRDEESFAYMKGNAAWEELIARQ